MVERAACFRLSPDHAHVLLLFLVQKNASYPDIASSFCEEEWSLLEPLLRQGLGVSVSTTDCRDVVARFMGEQWATGSPPV